MTHLSIIVQGNVTSGAVVPVGASSSFGGKDQAEAFTHQGAGNQIWTNENAKVRVTGEGWLLLVGRRISGVPPVVAGS
jgi:hypothetical protein